MKVRVEITSGRVIIKEINRWFPWGDGVKGYDKDENCILYVPAEHLVFFEVITEDKIDKA